MLLLLFAALTFASVPAEQGLPGDSVLTSPRLVKNISAQEIPPLSHPAPSTLNLTFDPRNWTLSWLCSRDITVTSCSATNTQRGKPRTRTVKNPHGCSCQFSLLILHLGVTLGVNATIGNVTISERLDYVVPGPLGSEAVNVSCEIHDAAAMTCVWGAGPGAPPDVHYFLVLRDDTGRQLPGCPDGPAPSGCRLDDLTGFPRQLHVTVAGSSRSGAIRAYDVLLNTKAIERLSPPRDVGGRCNTSHCAVSWAPPHTWADMGFADFRYELDLRRKDTNPDSTVTISSQPKNSFEFPSPEPRMGHLVRMRVGDVRSDRWSAWSPWVAFGTTRPAVSRLPVYFIATAATLICALGLVLVWRRFARHCLLPRIPEIRDKVSDNEHINPKILRKDLQQPKDKEVPPP